MKNGFHNGNDPQCQPAVTRVFAREYYTIGHGSKPEWLDSVDPEVTSFGDAFVVIGLDVMDAAGPFAWIY